MSERLLPRYPVYVPSKGRAQNGQTIPLLIGNNVPFHIVVEPQSVDEYAARFGEDRLLVLPENDRGLFTTRNWIKQHSIDAGYERHWQIDDNIRHFLRLFRGRKIPVDAAIALRVCEDFSDRYENVAVSGLNYRGFAAPQIAPYYVNVHVYSCTLVNNAIPYRWELAYNDDTDLCLQVLASGWCTLLVNVFLVDKVLTMSMRGGNTDDATGPINYQSKGRYLMAQALAKKWVQTAHVGWRFDRAQHVIERDWKAFNTPLRLKPDVDIPGLERWRDPDKQLTLDGREEPIRRKPKRIDTARVIDEYGMSLTQVSPPKDPRLRALLEEMSRPEGDET